jgi:hypothetical protein
MTKETKSTNLPPAPNSGVDLVFERVAVISTAIGFATALGTAACLQRPAGHGLELHWHWRAVIWMALGVWAALHLWQLVWRAQADTAPKAKARLQRFCALILIVALGVFVYPISFVSGEHFNEILTGLTLATAVLTFVGWMISRIIRGLNQADAADEQSNFKP